MFISSCSRAGMLFSIMSENCSVLLASGVLRILIFLEGIWFLSILMYLLRIYAWKKYYIFFQCISNDMFTFSYSTCSQVFSCDLCLGLKLWILIPSMLLHAIILIWIFSWVCNTNFPQSVNIKNLFFKEVGREQAGRQK